MDRIDLTGSLAFGTIGVVLLVLVVVLARFLSKPKNRHLMEGQHERNIAEIREGTPAEQPSGRAIK